MARVYVLLALICVVVAAGTARAESADAVATEAQKHWTSGMAHFQLEEWDDAIREWEAGFRLKPVPQFLYNIAQAYRQSKRYEKALAFYRKYLRMDPDAPNRAEVQGHINNLDKLVAEERAAPPPPPVAPPAKPAATEPASPPLVVTPAPAPATTTTEPARVELTAAPPPKKSAAHKAWVWGVVAGAVVVVAAAVTVGVVLGTADSAKTLPSVRF